MPHIRVVGTKLDYRNFDKDALPPTATVMGPAVAMSPASPFALAHAVEVSKDKVELDLTATETMQAWRAIQAMHRAVSNDYSKAPVYQSKLEPWDHQRAAYNLINLLDCPLLAMEPGTGKTKVAIDWISNHPGKVSLIIIPKSVEEVWRVEVAKHASIDLRLLSLVGQGVGNVKKVLTEAFDGTKPTVLLCNYEKVWRSDTRATLLANLDNISFLVLDEAHKVKNSGGKAAKFLYLLSHKLKCKKVGLTGTPIPESPLDAFGVLKVLNHHVFGTSKNKFYARYAKTIQISRLVSKVIGLKNQDELAMKLGWVSIQVPNTVLALPEQRHVTVPFALPKKVADLYKEFKNELVTEINGKYLTAPSRMSALTKLQQIAGGFLIRDNGEEQYVDTLHTAKVDALVDLVDGLEGRKVVVFARYRAEMQAIIDALRATGRAVGEISGKRNDYQGWKNLEYDTLVCQISAASTGLDLTEACYNIYYSMTFSNADYVQSLARSHRAGQTNKVIYYYLIASGTIDEAIHKAVLSKQEIVEACLTLARQEKAA